MPASCLLRALAARTTTGLFLPGRLGRSGRDGRADRSQHPARVLVLEDPLGIETGSHRLEAFPFRVAGRERRGRLEMALAPVRPALVVVHDRLDRAKVG